jgi:hypothetical protein
LWFAKLLPAQSDEAATLSVIFWLNDNVNTSATSAPLLTAIAAAPGNIAQRFGRWLGLLPAAQVLPRQRCHFVTVPLRGVPNKHVESAIKLRLQQLGLFSQIGFAYRHSGENAQVWYWDDAQALQLLPAGQIQPWPEALWRDAPAEGMRLLRCTEGFELEGVNPQGIYRSRWFAQAPGQEEQTAFCRDLGLEQTLLPLTPQIASLHTEPAAGWRAVSATAKPVPGWLLLCLLLITLAGAIGVAESVQLYRLKQQTVILKQQIRQLRAQTSDAARLESALGELRPTAEALITYNQSPRQLQWLAQLARLGIVGQVSDVYISEWNFRGNNVTATLRLGPKAKSADVLAMLEKATLFDDVILLPDPPQGTLRIQLKLPVDAATAPAGNEH